MMIQFDAALREKTNHLKMYLKIRIGDFPAIDMLICWWFYMGFPGKNSKVQAPNEQFSSWAGLLPLGTN